MTDLVTNVKCSITIILRDNTEISIQLNNDINLKDLKNYITAIDVNEDMCVQNNNPVGVVSSNTLKIELNSLDMSLFPENLVSVYHGLMDNTARINLKLDYIDGIVDFGTYYVSNWYSNISSSNPYKVIIEATDLLSIIGKNKVPSGIITQNLSTKDAFIYMLDSLNKGLSNEYKIQYNENNIDFSEFDKIEYDNLDTGDMSLWLNTISQCTLTNIYIDRNNEIKTDYCLDDANELSVATLSDKVNILNASVDTAGLVKYTGVKTNYITNSINNMSKITSVGNQLLKPGVNVFDDINFGSKVFRVNAIRLMSAVSSKLEISKIQYDKRNCSIEIINSNEEDVECSIEIYGQTLKENKLNFTAVKENSSNEILEVNNILIMPEYVEKFTNGLVSLIGIRNSSLSLNGFFNPAIKLGDKVYIDVSSSINTEGYYKVIGLQWKIGNTIKCTAKLIKTIV